MVLLDEEPHILLNATIGNFKIDPDKKTLARINEGKSTLQQARELRVREAESALKALSRKLTALSNHHAETVSSHSATAHASEIATLDTQKFRVAKAASDLEIESERLSSQLLDLHARLQELEAQGVEGGDAKRGVMDDEIGLKLKAYRGLGIDIERDEEGGEYNRAVVRNGRLGDVHVVNLDGKFSRFFYANYFWNVL